MVCSPLISKINILGLLNIFCVHAHMQIAFKNARCLFFTTYIIVYQKKVAFVLVAFAEWGRGRKRETYSITRLHKVLFGE